MTAKKRQLIDLKCFLQKPGESNYQILRDEMKALIKGAEVQEFHEIEQMVERAPSLEDWLNEFS